MSPRHATPAPLSTAELRDHLRRPPPREVDARVLQALQGGSSYSVRAPIALGAFFLLFSVPFLWLFFPWSFLEDVRIDFGAPLRAEGEVIAVRPTSISINNRRIQEIEFRFLAGDGRELRALCWSARAPAVGRRVPVEFLDEEPAVARIEGARRTIVGYFGLFIVIVPAAGLVVILLALRARRTPRRLARFGELARADIAALEPMTTPKRKRGFHVRFRYRAGQEDVELTRWMQEAAVTALSGPATSGDGLTVLYDPARPRRAVILEALAGTRP